MSEQPPVKPGPTDQDGDDAVAALPKATPLPEPETEVIHDGAGREIARVTTGTPAPSGREVLMPLDPEQVVEGMKAYQALLPKLLDDSDYQQTRDGKFVKKSGWRKIARAFNLSVAITPGSLRVERDEKGNAVRAECVARAVAPNGVTQDADGYCSIDEKRFEAWRDGRGESMKIENDLRATATTRAKNRAISDLVGMGEVSAEEIDGAGAVGGSVPDWAIEANGDEKSAASKALTLLVGDEDLAREAWGEIKQAAGGAFPRAVATALVRAAVAFEKSVSDQTKPPTEEGS